MELVAVRVAAGLLVAGLGVGALAAISRLGGARQGLLFPALGMAVASVLAWPALVRWTWAPAAVAALVAAGAALALRPSGFPGWRRPRPAEALALLLLAVNALYAALPDYRYDQWSDHLVIAKATRAGPLAPPILNDHLAFTGAWEFLFTVPRFVSADDVFNHSAANAFSWLFLAVGLLGLVRRLESRAFPRGPAALLVLVWVLFALPDEPGLMNAKPDPVLLLAAIAVLDLLSLPRHERSRADVALLAFFLVAPFGLKLTWLHFAAVAVPAALWTWRPPWPRDHLIAAFGGLVGAAVVVLPYVVKNTVFFGNPVYPVEWGPFRSPFWSPAMEEYWRTAMAPARSVEAWSHAVLRVPLGLLWYLWPLALPVLVVSLLALVRRLESGGPEGASVLPRPEERPLARLALVLGGVYALVWPLFYHAGVDARFVFPGLAALAVALWVAMGTAFAAAVGGPRPSRLAATLATSALFLPAAVFGHLPTKVERLATWPAWTVERLMEDGPAEWRLLADMRSINRHRRETFPGAGFGEAIALVDVHGVYLLDGASVVIGGLEYEWHRQRASCVWQLLVDLDVRYVFLRTGRLDTFPELQPLEGGLIALSERRQAFAVDRAFLEHLRAEDPACRPGSGR